jgi:hypothetical protein
MTEGEVGTAEAIYGRGNSPSQIEALIRERFPGQNERQSGQSKVTESTPVIIATLSGIGFTIDPSGPQTREIKGKRPAQTQRNILMACHFIRFAFRLGPKPFGTSLQLG